MLNVDGPSRHITMTSISRTFNDKDPNKPNYKHVIRWDPASGCPEGFIVQKVKRDMKYSTGSVQARDARWVWGPEHTLRAEYWELWEVVTAWKSVLAASAVKGGASVADRIRAGAELRIYPGITELNFGGQLYATANGEVSETALKTNTEKRPPKSPAYCDYWAHDTFVESRPNAAKGEGCKGTFKIKGSAYFLPLGEAAADDWVDRYLSTAIRFKRIRVLGSYYTGGALWQREGDFGKPAGRYRILTRYEAGTFYDVQSSHIKSSCVNPPAVECSWKERDYPGAD